MSHLGVIGRLLDDLGRHPEGRAHKGVALDLGVGELARHPKVGQLHLTLLGQEHVGSCRDGGIVSEKLQSIQEAFGSLSLHVLTQNHTFIKSLGACLHIDQVHKYSSLLIGHMTQLNLVLSCHRL